jgi:hypothetical protein
MGCVVIGRQDLKKNSRLPQQASCQQAFAQKPKIVRRDAGASAAARSGRACTVWNIFFSRITARDILGRRVGRIDI